MKFKIITLILYFLLPFIFVWDVASLAPNGGSKKRLRITKDVLSMDINDPSILG